MKVAGQLVNIGYQLLVLQLQLVVRYAVPKVGVVLSIGYMVLNLVLQVVHIDLLNVKLVVVVLYFHQKIVVCFAGGGHVEFIAQAVDGFALLP
jgi:hypothetical protein